MNFSLQLFILSYIWAFIPI